MLATKECIWCSRVICLDFISYQNPNFLNFLFGGSYFEVVDVDNDNGTMLRVPIGPWPFVDDLETLVAQHGITVLLPVVSRLWVPVEDQTQRANGVPHPGLLPFVWPSVIGLPHVSRRAAESGLAICHVRVALLKFVAR